MSKRVFSGFALMEMLVMATLLVGLAAMIIRFSHQRQAESNARKVGGALSVIASEFIEQSAPGGTCYSEGANIYSNRYNDNKIKDCIDIPDSVVNILEKNQISINDLSLVRGISNSQTLYPLLQISIDTPVDTKTAAIYAEEVMNQLTTTALNYLCINYPLYFDYPPFSYKNQGSIDYAFYVHYE